MDRRCSNRRPRPWPAAAARPAGGAGRGPARVPALARPKGAADEERLSPLPGLRATVNAFCYFFAPDSADPARRP